VSSPVGQKYAGQLWLFPSNSKFFEWVEPYSRVYHGDVFPWVFKWVCGLQNFFEDENRGSGELFGLREKKNL